MSRPRMLVVGPLPPPVHGTSMYVRMLLDSSALAAEWDVRHLDTSDRRSLGNLGRFDVTNVRLALAHVGRLARRVRDERVRVVWIPVSQNGPAYFRDALFIHGAHAGGARVVTHLHGGWFGEFYEGAPGPLRWLIRTSSARVDQAWVLGDGLRAAYRGLIPDTRLRVVPNGVADPLAGIEPAVRGQGATNLLHLGQLSVGKGVLDLIEAVRTVVRSGRKVRLVLAGPWLNEGDEAEIRAAASAPALAGVVEIHGVVTGAEKGRLLARADVFVLASRAQEGQPLSILEAMAAGLPVVATRRGAVSDAVEEGVTGRIVPPGEPAALARALGDLVDDVDLRAVFGAAGRRRWAREFTAERGVARVLEALSELLGDGSIAPSEAAPSGYARTRGQA